MKQANTDLNVLRDFLIAQSFRPQQRLPAERDLAEQLGLTRNRLRGGLRKLEAEGLIWRHVGRGTFFGHKPLSANGRSSAESVGDLTNPGEILEARLALEPELARLAAQRATARQIVDMERCLEQMARTENWEMWSTFDTRLHSVIAGAARNALLFVLFDTLQTSRTPMSWGRLQEHPRVRQRRAAATDEHVAIVRAIRERDADRAAKHMREHLLAVRDVTLGAQPR
jgi:DNA-binding FadR family transcriptional regulator